MGEEHGYSDLFQIEPHGSNINFGNSKELTGSKAGSWGGRETGARPAENGNAGLQIGEA